MKQCLRIVLAVCLLIGLAGPVGAQEGEHVWAAEESRSVSYFASGLLRVGRGFPTSGGEAPRMRYGLTPETGEQVLHCAAGQISTLAGGAGVSRHGNGCRIITGQGAAITGGYDYIGDFSEGLAPVSRGGTYGYLDETGREAIPLRYAGALPFSHGIAPVKMEHGWGYIDRSGAVVIPGTYTGAAPFVNGLGMVHVGDSGRGHHIGFVDRSGCMAIPAIYDSAQWLEDGLLLVEQGEKSGILDRRGQVVLPVSYDEVGQYGGGMFCVRIGDCWGVRDTRDLEVVPAQYDEIFLSEAGIVFVRSGGDWGALQPGRADAASRRPATQALPMEYGGAYLEENGFVLLRKGACTGLCNRDGTLLLPCSYQVLEPVGAQIYWAEQEGQQGYLDKTGAWLASYGRVHGACFQEGLLAVEQGGKQGFMDARGNLAVPCVWDEVGSFCQGMAPVRRGTAWGMVDRTGQVLIPPAYNEISAIPNGHGLMSLSLDGAVMCMGRRGRSSHIVTERPCPFQVDCPLCANCGVTEHGAFWMEREGW